MKLTLRKSLTRSIFLFAASMSFALAQVASHGQSSSFNISLKNGFNGYEGAEDFYTMLMEGGVFNSETDLDDQSLVVEPLESDTKFVIRFKNVPLSRSSGSISRVALVLTLKESPRPDTLLAYNLNDRDVWDERLGNYNSLNGSAPWSGVNGKLVDAWSNIDAVAKVSGGEKLQSTIIFEFYPNDAAARRALLDSWLDGNNQGIAIEGMSARNAFYSSEAYTPIYRPELIIEYFSN